MKLRTPKFQNKTLLCSHVTVQRSILARAPLCLVFTLFSAAGCAQSSRAPEQSSIISSRPIISSAGDINVAVYGAQSMSLHPNARVVGSAPNDSAERVRRDTDIAAISEFRDHGFDIVQMGGGDRVIAYAIGLSETVDDETLFNTFGIAPGLDTDAGLSRGGIIMVVLNPRTDTVLWRGCLSGPADAQDDNDQERYKQIAYTVCVLLSSLQDRRVR